MEKVLEVIQAEKQLRIQLSKGDTSPLHVELQRAVGVDILETVSSDLYKNPFHVMRELIQNSYDENAENVEVLVTGGSVAVKDDGRGMDFRTLVSTRRLSESEKVYNPDKYPAPVRGFRKLGIYSGYQIAKALVLRTKESKKDFELILSLDFERMRIEVLRNRERSEKERWDFKLLVEKCTYVKGEKIDSELQDINESYTVAQLVDVQGSNPDAWAKLSNEKELAKYVVETFSLDFDKMFDHRAKIHSYLKDRVPGFHPFTIKLCTADGEQILRRPAITDVEDVKLVTIPKNSRHPLAIGWIGRRKDRALEDRSARGIVFKVGGITIGPRTAGSGGATSDHGYFYDRLTGEFHVIDPEIKPDPERANFNPSVKTDQLLTACNEIVNDVVRDAREDRRASTGQDRSEKKVQKLIADWAKLKPKLDARDRTYQERVQTAGEVAICLKELKHVQIAVPPRLADEAAKNIQEMEATLGRALVPSQPLGKQERKKGKTSLHACLSREERSSLPSVIAFLELVDEVLWEQCGGIGDLYDNITRTIAERWTRPSGGRG